MSNEDVSEEFHDVAIVSEFHLTNSIENLVTQLAEISNGSVSIDLYANYNVPKMIKGNCALVKSILLSLILKTHEFSSKNIVTILMSSQQCSESSTSLIFKFIGVEAHKGQGKLKQKKVDDASGSFYEFVADIPTLQEVVRENLGRLEINYEDEYFKNIELVLPFSL